MLQSHWTLNASMDLFTEMPQARMDGGLTGQDNELPTIGL